MQRRQQRRPQPTSNLILPFSVVRLSVRRAQGPVLPPADANADVVLRRDAEGASQRHLRSPLRQTHGDLRRPVPVERGLVVPPPVVRFLTEFFGISEILPQHSRSKK